MVRSGKQMFDILVIFGGGPFHSGAPAFLTPVSADRCAFNVPVVGDGNNHVLIGDHILNVEILGRIDNLRASPVAVAAFQLIQFGFDDLHLYITVHQYPAIFNYLLDDTFVFVIDLVALKSGKFLQTHVENGFRLQIGKSKLFSELAIGFRNILAGPDGFDDLIKIVDPDFETFKYMRPGFGLIQIVNGTADDNLNAVINIVADQFLHIHHLRPAFYQGQVNHTERALHLCVLVELIQYHTGYGTSFEHDHNPHALAVALIANIGDFGYFLSLNQLGNLLDKRGFVHLVGNFRYHDLLTVIPQFFHIGKCTHNNLATACFVGIFHTFVAVDDTTCREIRRGDMLHQIRYRNIIIIDVGLNAGYDFCNVVGRHVGRHTYRNTRRSVDQQVRQHTRHNRGLAEGIIKVRLIVDRIFVDVAQKFLGDTLHAHFRVPHGRGRVTIHRTEVALAVYKGVAERKFLHHPYYGIIHRGVAVRVILTKHFTNNTGTFLVGTVVQHTEIAHAV